jgi:hypothetical protein
VEDQQQQSSARFWLLWSQLAGAISLEPSPDALPVLRALFLEISWKEDTRIWKPLANHGDLLLALFEQLASNPHTLRSFALLAARFRDEFIPMALPALARKATGLSERRYLDQITMTSLEGILRGLVYSGAFEIRRKPDMRTAVLDLLDLLVDAGSSIAFKMRDDFLTPLRS